MRSNSALQISGLTKSYGSVQALRGVELDVQAGEIFGFLGPNGAGKTTTIRCLLDLIRPDGGEIRVLGLNPQADPVGVRERTGYLPGELQLDDNLTAERQLRFFNDMRGGRADWAHARQLAERLSLDLKRPIKNLSKGNKQKVGVVQALMHRPELLLLDEPTSGLDPLMQQEVLALIRDAKAHGATVFFSSHIISEVEAVAERVGIIRAGEIVQVTDPAAMVHLSLRHVTVDFDRPVNSAELAQVTGVQVLSGNGTSTSLTLQVTGKLDALIKALGEYPVNDLETTRPSLEELFLAYYK